ATLYVTLEPCAHFGKTPPCTNAIIQAGVTRVVFSAHDPNPQARGGAEVLAVAGIEVKGDVEITYARSQNAPFFKRYERGGAFVALKLAMSLDARLNRTANQRERVTGDQAEQEVHRLRSGFDAVMIGSNTARVDDPLLTVRRGFMSIRPPVRVVIDTNGTLSSQSALLRSVDEAPLWVVAGADGETARLADSGARVLTAPVVQGRIDLAAAVQALEAAGISSILCEGGAVLGAGLLEAGLVDRIYAFVAPRLFGGCGTAAFPLKNPLTDPGWRLQRIAQHGEDALLMLDRCSPD
ncbi:MAG TPA: bifunctional diaminohydroxyphosphoribosylaminopyrimidine deaminase/5-amino-6-(5-phosphoribosylamino)uracil reductase RibD, partial [Hyphomicrobiaceae bacterium]